MPKIGYKFSEQARKNISEGRKGKALGNKNASGQIHSEERKRKHTERMKGNSYAKGFKFSEEQKRSLGDGVKKRHLDPEYRKRNTEILNAARKLCKHGPASEEARRNMSLFQKGRPKSEEHKRKIGDSNRGKLKPLLSGENNPNWKGGLTPKNLKIRNSTEMKNWRRYVFERDDYTCQLCGIRGGPLHADHIKPFSLFPELRFELSNGRTLCVPCHKTTDTYLTKVIGKTREDFK